MRKAIDTSNSRWFVLHRTVLWFLILFSMLMVIAGFLRFFIHREAFAADFSSALAFVGYLAGGFWNWLVFEVPTHIATLAVGLLALLVGLLGWSQKRKADRKAEWWRRTQYAIDLALSNDKHRIIAGFAILQHSGAEVTKRTFLSPNRKTIADADDLKLFGMIARELKRNERLNGRVRGQSSNDEEGSGNA